MSNCNHWAELTVSGASYSQKPSSHASLSRGRWAKDSAVAVAADMAGSVEGHAAGFAFPIAQTLGRESPPCQHSSFVTGSQARSASKTRNRRTSHSLRGGARAFTSAVVNSTTQT